jgi:hypothetical protein
VDPGYGERGAPGNSQFQIQRFFQFKNFTVNFKDVLQIRGCAPWIHASSIAACDGWGTIKMAAPASGETTATVKGWNLLELYQHLLRILVCPLRVHAQFGNPWKVWNFKSLTSRPWKVLRLGKANEIVLKSLEISQTWVMKINKTVEIIVTCLPSAPSLPTSKVAFKKIGLTSPIVNYHNLCIRASLWWNTFE